jgi:SAM-dependent methyltransferase
MGDTRPTEDVVVLRGRLPGPDEPEFRELQLYESGAAEVDAARIPGRHAEPWLNVIDFHEPGCPPALRQALSDPRLAPRWRGRVVDLGAGCCWAAAHVSKLPAVEEVWAVDLSERFLRHVGLRVARTLEARVEKLRLVASSFETVPLPTASCDVALLLAAIHHSLAPLRVLMEARRLLKDHGLLVVIESPAPLPWLARQRRESVRLSRETSATEVAYTRGELGYLLAHAGFSNVRWSNAGTLSANPGKRMVRRCLRGLGIEGLLGAVTYVVSADSVHLGGAK